MIEKPADGKWTVTCDKCKRATIAIEGPATEGKNGNRKWTKRLKWAGWWIVFTGARKKAERWQQHCPACGKKCGYVDNSQRDLPDGRTSRRRIPGGVMVLEVPGRKSKRQVVE